MKNNAKRRRSSAVTALLFALAAVLLLTGTIGSVRAAPLVTSQSYSAGLQVTARIGVTLLENGEELSWRNFTGANGAWSEKSGVLLENMLAQGEALKLGKAYDEQLKVNNSGTIDEYVRVRLYRYWTDENGNKLTELSPELIDLHLLEENGWVKDTRSSTAERTVLYYTRPLPVGESTPAFADTLTIDGSVARRVNQQTTQSDDGAVITTVYAYNGVRFQIEAEVDAVQTHNAEAAIWSAWGQKVTVADGVLQLPKEVA